MTTIEDVRERLSEVRPVGLGRDVLAAGLVQDVKLDRGEVTVAFTPGPLPPPVVRATVEEIRRVLGALDGVRSVDVRLAAPPPSAAEASPLPGVAEIVAVSSTKGGVGKSTVAVNLACAMVRLGLRVGVLDADVYGPSLPTLLGLSGRPAGDAQGKVLPLERYGLKAMSTGFFLDDDAPVIWRGPLVTGLLRQFLKDVAWGDLDLLLIDMPPGTGDAQLTLVQQVPLAGGVVVTTPQAVSLLDVERGIAMFQQVNTPVLGIVENMSFFVCPHCGEREEPFGSGGGLRLEKDFGVPLLGQIPLLAEIRAGGDAGTPIVVEQPDHAVSRIYLEIAQRVLEGVAAEHEQAPAPRIIG
jgi:ATP-binding protein involved in chromosome partitioning